MTQFPIDRLKSVMDSVRTDTDLSPVKTQYGMTTFCNLNVYRVAQALVFAAFYNYDAERPMLANEMIYFMEQRPELFSKFGNHEIAHGLVNKGYLIFAAQRAELHGHICPVYPSDKMLTSGKWRCSVPYVSNVGARNDIMGLNYAFGDVPFYYLVI